MAPLEAWVATIEERSSFERTSDLATQALLHNDVVNAAMATGRTPLPARFGSRFADDAACAEHIIDKRDDLLRALARVADSIEIGVLIVPREPLAPKLSRPARTAAGPGRRYLESLRDHARAEAEQRVRLEQIADRIASSVGNIVRSAVRSVDRRGVLSITHLVPRNEIERYRQRVEAAQAATNPDFRVVLGEPRAPYAFAQLRLARDGHDSSSPIRGE
jgi:hypothetical protein